jgi:glycosyltransferase involved in cell wall biosynthesis
VNAESAIRVCFVSPKSYPLFRPDTPGVFGGAEVDLFLLGTELAKDPRFEVSFVVADYGQAPEEMAGPVRLIRSLNFRAGGLTGAMRVWKALRTADAAVYMIKTASPGVPLTAAFCRRHRRSFIYRTASARESDGRYRREHPILGRAFDWSLRQAATVLSQNQADRDNLFRTTRIDSVVIQNGHPIPPRMDAPREFVLWAGRSEPVKGPSRFLDLALALPQERFVMLCPRATGDNDYDRLRDAARAIANLQWHDAVPFHQTDGFFQRAKALVNTSDTEGFANAFIQACARGTPIVSLSVNPDLFLTRHSCGIECGGKPERLLDAMRFLLEGDRYIELGKNARAYAEGHHDIARIVERYKELFTRLAANRPR